MQNESDERERAEERLRLLSLAVEQISEGLAVSDLAGTLLLVNRAFAAMHGYTAEELVGESLSVFHTPEQMPAVDAANRQIRETGEFNGEIWHVRRDGTVFPTLMHNSLLRNEAGEPAGMIATVRDMTERRRAEEAQREAERERAIVLDTVSEAVTYLDRGLRVIWANRAAAELCGIPADQMAGQHCYAIWYEADEPCETCAPRRAMETGEVQEGEVATPDGRAFHVRAYPVRDEAGAVVGTVEVALDVTERERAKQQRRESEQEKALILGSIAELVSFQDTELRILWANRAAAETVGLKAEDLVGRYCYDVWCQRAGGSPQCPVRRAIEAGEPCQAEITTPDGRVWEIRGYPARDDDGQILGAVEVTLEITERRRAEEEARRQSAFRTTLIEASPAFFVAIDREGRTLMMNESMLLALGYTLEEVVDTDYLATFVPERERERLGRLFHRLTDLKSPALNENHVLTKDGRELLVEWHGRPVVNEDDEFQFFFGVGIDITERRRAEQEIRESEARYRAIVEDATELICRFRPDGTLTFVNGAYCRYFGRQPHELVGQSFYALIPEADREAARERLAAISPERAVVSHEHRVTLPDGTMHWQHWTNRAILDDQGRVVEVQAIGRDVTAMREQQQHLEELVAARTAELREVNAELEAFAYTVSHDLRAPLRAVEGFSTALVEDYGERLDAEGRDYALSITRAARRMDTLIRDLLAYSRVGRTAMALVPVELGHVVRESFMQLAAIVQDSGAAIAIEDELPVVLAHHPVLVQAVTNLLSNAIKFVAPGERPRVRVRAERRGETVRLWVEDEGIGIAAESQERIFTAFERLHPADHYPGTGIGLAVVRRGIERMGGQVGVESEPGRGSRFWIELPAADAGPPED